MEANESGRRNQRRRTRKDLLAAAARLVKAGRRPSLDEIAEEALVSRATAYRYFANAEAALREAELDVATPAPDQIFTPGAPADPVARALMADTALHDMMLANETALRLMLAQSLNQSIEDGEWPRRQNRRLPLIEAALAPGADQFTPEARTRLAQALALIMGTEGFIVLADVLQLEDAPARALKAWAIRALIEASRAPAHPN